MFQTDALTKQSILILGELGPAQFIQEYSEDHSQWSSSIFPSKSHLESKQITPEVWVSNISREAKRAHGQ